MHNILIMRLEAPLMSFGAPIVDSLGVIQDFPSLSQLTGMLGNALGYRHKDFNLLEQLQKQIIYSVACLAKGEKITDFQTADLGQSFMVGTGWTTRGRLETRGGGNAASKGTHIRHRDYWANASFIVALRLTDKDQLVTVLNLSEALKYPARPLFIGRKTCIPSVRIFEETIQADSTFSGLVNCLSNKHNKIHDLEVWTSEKIKPENHFEKTMVTDERDWKNQIHVGQRKMYHGLIQMEA